MDSSQAAAWFQKAADQGYGDAQNQLKLVQQFKAVLAPPPGNAMALSTAQARAILTEITRKKYVGTIKSWGDTGDLSAVTDVHVGAGGFDVVAPFTWDGKANDGKYSIKFDRTISYLQAYHFKFGQTFYAVGFLPKPERSAFGWGGYNGLLPVQLIWTDEMDAQRFADAFNRLVYAAHRNELGQEYQAFAAAAKAWRENPVKPPLSPEADNQWVLAENAVKEKNLDSAVEHYEAALQIQSMWPTGWFDLAMIYGEQQDFADAADAMKHYLELVPNAPDAKAAHDQMIIWQDKAKQ